MDIAIVLLFLGMMGVSFYISGRNIGNEPLNIGFFVLGFAFIPITFGVVRALVVDAGLGEGLVNIMEGLYITTLWLFVVIIFYIIGALLYRWSMEAINKGERKNRGDYD